MKITRINPLTGKERTKDIPISEDQYNKYVNGQLIQDIAPELSDDHREFIISGMTGDEFDELFN